MADRLVFLNVRLDQCSAHMYGVIGPIQCYQHAELETAVGIFAHSAYLPPLPYVNLQTYRVWSTGNLIYMLEKACILWKLGYGTVYQRKEWLVQHCFTNTIDSYMYCEISIVHKVIGEQLKLRLGSGKLWWTWDWITGSFTRQNRSTVVGSSSISIQYILFHYTVPVFEYFRISCLLLES